jgi:hypothetical protein
MGDGDVDEFLVVGVVAGDGGFDVGRRLRDCGLRHRFDVTHLRRSARLHRSARSASAHHPERKSLEFEPLNLRDRQKIASIAFNESTFRTISLKQGCP